MPITPISTTPKPLTPRLFQIHTTTGLDLHLFARDPAAALSSAQELFPEHAHCLTGRVTQPGDW